MTTKSTKTIKTKENAAFKIPTAFDLSELLVKHYRACPHNNEVYVFNYGTGCYVEVDERETTMLLKRMIGESDMYKIPLNTYKQAYKILLNQNYINNEVARISNPQSCILFKNGMFNILTGDRVSTSDMFCTYQVDANYSNKIEKTPVFDAFLNSITGNDVAAQKIILAFIGYCLLPEIHGNYFFVLGPGLDNGKTTFGHFLAKLVGGDDVVSYSLFMNSVNKSTLSPIIGSHLSIDMNMITNPVSKTNAKYIKMLSGGEAVELKRKYNKPLMYTNNAKLIFGTNSPVQFDVDDDIFWDRMILVPFIEKIPKENQNHNLLNELWEERDGIVMKGINAVKDVIQNDYKFPECRYTQRTKNIWRYSIDGDVIDFIEEFNTIKGIESEMSLELLYSEYKKYCMEYNTSAKNITNFSYILKDHFNFNIIHRDDDELVIISVNE